MRVLLDGWQLSGESDWATGDWAPVMFTTVDNFDFTGGEGGQGTDLGGGFRTVRPVLVGDPLSGGGDPLTGYFNTAAFGRPAKGSYGNAPRNAVRKPSVNNTNFAVFKNVELRRQQGGTAPRRDLQSIQPGGVPGHRPHGPVRRRGCADQPELRDRDRDRQSRPGRRASSSFQFD